VDALGWGCRRAALASAAVVVLVLAGPPGAAAGEGKPGGIASAKVRQGSQSILDYWTPRRMREARPLDLEPPDVSPNAAAPDVPPRATPRRSRAGSGSAAFAAGSPPGAASDPDLVIGRVGASADDDGPYGRHLPFTSAWQTDTTAYPHRTHGKVFGTLAGLGDYVCSATAVPGNTQSTVITAGHCVFEGSTSGFARNWMFVPGYDEGEKPYGAWPARRLVAASGFVRNDDNLNLDVGAAELRAGEDGRPLHELTGTRGIAFNQPRDQAIDVYGHPAEPPFTGERLWVCSTEYGGNDPATLGYRGPPTMLVGCDMTAGASGGGWVVGESLPESGYVTSVVSYGYSDEPDHLYGPYFGAAARKVWLAAQDSCQGRFPTHTGTAGPDRIKGTSGDDVILAKAGNDRVNGRGGNDRICGGGGRDKLKGKGGRDRIDGEGGNDRLAGGGGPDRMDGGSGRDRCAGGPGRDRARGCERTSRVP
jgi:hypothetical protein